VAGARGAAVGRRGLRGGDLRRDHDHAGPAAVPAAETIRLDGGADRGAVLMAGGRGIEIIDGKAFAAARHGRQGEWVGEHRREGLRAGSGHGLTRGSPTWAGSRWCWSARIRPARSTCATRGARPSRRHAVLRAPPAARHPEDELLDLVARLNADPRSTASSCSCRCRRRSTRPGDRRHRPGQGRRRLPHLNVGRWRPGQPALVPCTPLGCLMLLRDRLGEPVGAEAVVSAARTSSASRWRSCCCARAAP
jgi:hypothetical protein